MLKPIPDFPHYFADEEGNIWSTNYKGIITMPKKLKPTIDRHGYLFVVPTFKNKQRRSFVHRLVLFAFVGEPSHGQICRHLDGNPKNNHVSNLQWGTMKENQADRKLHNTDLNGGNCPWSKLTDKEVTEILHSSEPQKLIAKKYKVDPSTISNIKRGKNWKQLTTVPI